MLNAQTIADAKAHARAEFPKESCGLVLDGRYQAMINVAEDPLNFFEMNPVAYARFATGHWGKLEAVLHSHPNGPLYPSSEDMRSQIATNVAWGIIPLDDERIGDPLMWGADTPVPAILGRQFMHGVTDCYSLIRDAYRLGRTALAEQGIDWPFDPIELLDFARNDNWWASEDDLYKDNFAKAGFSLVSVADVRPGDVFMVKLKSHKLNHGGLLLPGGLIMHHLPQRLSRREPAGLWGRQADLWVRYHA